MAVVILTVYQSVRYDKTFLVGTWHTRMPWGAVGRLAPAIGIGPDSALSGIRSPWKEADGPSRFVASLLRA